MLYLHDLALLMPELVLAVGGMLALVFGLFVKDTRYSVFVCALVLLSSMVALYMQPQMGGIAVFGGQLSLSLFTQGMKFLLLAVTIMVLAMTVRSLSAHNLDRPEFPVLIVLATLGMFVMLSAKTWLSFYLGLELQSLSFYVLTAFARDNARAGEAGAKYFILGALASGFLLFGMSYIFGATGSLSYDAPVVYGQGFGVGMAFVLAGIAFKLALVPFHMWTPDVYDGAPMPVTAYFALAPKIAALGALAQWLVGPFQPFAGQAMIILLGLGLFSLVWGAFAGLRQNSLKRLLAYSAIANIGIMILAMASGTLYGMVAAFNYLFIYIAMSGVIFAALLGLKKDDDQPVENLSDLAGLSRSHPALAWSLALTLFALAGIPPMAGFFAKFAAFKAVILGDLVPIAAVGVAASVVAAAYYLRLIKIMFFDAPHETALIHDTCLARRAVLVLTTAVVVSLVIVPDAVMGFVSGLCAVLIR